VRFGLPGQATSGLVPNEGRVYQGPPGSRFSYPPHEDCQTTSDGKSGTIDVPPEQDWKNIMKTFKKLVGGAISLAGVVVIVTQHL
jgi:hypothetical protein